MIQSNVQYSLKHEIIHARWNTIRNAVQPCVYACL